MRLEPKACLTSALLALSAALTPAHAQTITPALKACMTVPDRPARLACYDTEMKRIEGASAAASPSVSAPGANAPSSVSAAAPASPAPPAALPAVVSAAPAASAPPVAPAPPVASAPPTASPQKQFGLPPTADRERRLPSRITARVASATRQASGRYIITLENGEVWLQTDDELGFAPRRGSAVSIKRGVLNSYWMRDRYYVVAVRRVR